MNLYSQFFNGKHVLVTGHTGFIGTWLTKSLVMLGSKVCGYSLDPCTDPNLFDALNLSEQIIDCRADILDRKKLENMILEFKPEIVFHLASQPIVLEAYDNPFTTFETNVTGTVVSCKMNYSLKFNILFIIKEICITDRSKFTL